MLTQEQGNILKYRVVASSRTWSNFVLVQVAALMIFQFVRVKSCCKFSDLEQLCQVAALMMIPISTSTELLQILGPGDRFSADCRVLICIKCKYALKYMHITD